MRRFFAALAAAMLWQAVAFAQAGPILSKELRVTGQTPPIVLDGVACDAAAADLTWTSQSGEGVGYGVGLFQLDLTDADASETQITITPYVRVPGSSQWAIVPPCDDVTDGTCNLVGSGAITCTSASSCLSGSANPSFAFRIDFLGFANIRLVVACTGGAAADLVTLRGGVSAQ